MVAAVIVLYNPNMPLLDRLLRSVVGQVEKIYLIDNTPEPPEELFLGFNQWQRMIDYLPLRENTGIATAQNIGIRRSIRAGYSHILLLDQDSGPSSDMVRKLLNAEGHLLRQGKQVAAVGPLFVDDKNGKTSCAVRHGFVHVKRIYIKSSATEPIETDYLIASGSLIRASTFAQIGLMCEELFIDWVDLEWCLRCRSSGLLSYIVPDAAMSHSIGDATVRVFGIHIQLHSEIRNYYIVRNAVYLFRKKGMGWRWHMVTVINVPKHIVVHSWFSDHRWRSLVLLSTAFVDGLSGNMTRFRAK